MASIGRFLLTVAIFAAVWGVYSAHRSHAPQQPPAVAAPLPAASDSESGARESDPSEFRCDGRTYCSQMTSCDEAKYFLAHCPNVKMDGDHDGIPCEQQWCPNG